MSLLTNILAKLRAHVLEFRERVVVNDYFAYAGLAVDLEQIVGQDVDVARRDRLRSARPRAPGALLLKAAFQRTLTTMNSAAV